MAGKTPHDDAREDATWQDQFLEELGQTSNVTAAAKKAGVKVHKVYRERRLDEGFAAAWRDALCEGYDNLEMDLLFRLRKGELAGGETKKRATRKFDNAAGFRLLTAHRDTVGREKARRSDLSEEAVMASIDAKLDQMRQRQRNLGGLLKENSVHQIEEPDES